MLDTEGRYTEAFNRIINKYGKNFTWEIKAKTMGFHILDSLKMMIEWYDLPLTPDEFWTQLQPHYEELFAESQMMPGYKKHLFIIYNKRSLFFFSVVCADSESVYKTIYNNIVSEFGHKYGGEVAYQVLGRPELVGFQIITDYYKLPLTVEQFQQKYHQMQQDLFVQVRVMPGLETKTKNNFHLIL